MRRIALVLLLGSLACKPSDPKDPATWIGQLSDADAHKRVEAVQQLRKLKAKQAAPQVAPLLKDQQVKEEAALALQDLGGPAEVPALIEAVDTTVGAGSDQATRVANRTNARVAEALGDIGDSRAGPALLRLSRSQDGLVRLGAVQALGNVGFKDAVPELAHIVDDEAAPPLLIKKAIVSLGKLGDAGAIPALLHGLLLERSGVSFLPESSYALFLLGAPAVEPLLRIAQDQDAAWLAWAKENNRAPAGTYAKAALVLGDLGDARAVPVLLAKLKYTDPDPNPGTAKLLTNLVREFAANALGRLRAQEATAPILALVQTKDPQDEGLIGFAGEALVWIGDATQAKELLKRAQAGAIRSRLIAAQAASLLGDGSLAKELAALAAHEEKGANQGCLKALAELQLQVEKEKDACALVAAQFGELLKPLEAAGRCAGIAACWMQQLQDQEPLVRARAAYELGRETFSQAVPALVTAAKDPDLRVRTAAIRALEWLLPQPAAKALLKAASAPLAAQLAAEQGKMEVSKVNEELRRLQTRLSRL